MKTRIQEASATRLYSNEPEQLDGAIVESGGRATSQGPVTLPDQAATIRRRKHDDGTVACQAIIRIKRKGKIVYRESRTFWKYQAAVSWARRREVELEIPSKLAAAQAERKRLAELIRWYIDQFYEIAQWQQSKQSALRFLERHEIGMEDIYQLSAPRLVQHVRSRREQRAGPATAQTDLVYIGVVLKVAQARREAGFNLDFVQRGFDPENWKPMKTVGPGVNEIRIRDDSGAFRVIYLATRPEAVYVLHCFQKKTEKTSQHDIDLAKRRFKDIPKFPRK